MYGGAKKRGKRGLSWTAAKKGSGEDGRAGGGGGAMRRTAVVWVLAQFGWEFSAREFSEQTLK